MNTNLHPQLKKYHEKFNLSNSSPLFDYSDTIYINNKILLKIKCLKCDTLFSQSGAMHLLGKQGNCMCRPTNKKRGYIICNFRKNQNSLPLFIKKAQAINNNINEFNYDNITFEKINGSTSVTNIKCNKCSLLFDQRVDKHLEGQGCKRCRSHMHDIETYRGRPTTLYYIKVNDMYKIGLTMRSVKSRFSKKENSSLIQEIKTWSFENGEEAYILEQKIISSYSHLKYNYQKYGEILSSGNSELFTENIFEEIVPLIELF